MKGTIKYEKKNKKGRPIGSICLEKNGKEKIIHIPESARLRAEYDGKECEFEMDSAGRVIRIVVDGNEIFKNFATVPFNFVPLNKIVVPAETGTTKDFIPPAKFDTYEDGKNTGYIECTLETITPLYIGMDAKTEKFFNIKEEPVIPGSSLRGMIRTLVQIVSWSKFKFFNDDLLHYRWLADKIVDLRNYYSERIKEDKYTDRGKRYPSYKFHAGYIHRRGFKYYIKPAERDRLGRQAIQIKREEVGNPKEFSIKKREDGSFLMVSGKMHGKKHEWIIYKEDNNAKEIEIPEEDIKAYRNDKLSKAKIDLLKRADKEPTPCFYMTWADDKKGTIRVMFGHTGYFRLSYEKTIGDHIIQKCPEGFKYDIDEAIFGKESEFAGRVFFEDAKLLSDKNDIFLRSAYPKILSSPKPTAVQLYLEQNDQNRIMHYDDDVLVRGYKLYWHRDGVEWRETDNNKINTHRTQYEKKIQPIKKGAEFKFRIRFENLSDVELGALLFVLNLPENHYHKLGMGKPLGLGSVKITPQLFLSNRKERYERLFDEDKVTWNLAESEKNRNDFKKYENAFEKYMLGKIGNKEMSSVKSLWDIPRLKQLKIMLDWDNTKLPNWNKITEYMDLTDNRWRNRAILPYPEKVVQLAK